MNQQPPFRRSKHSSEKYSTEESFCKVSKKDLRFKLLEEQLIRTEAQRDTLQTKLQNLREDMSLLVKQKALLGQQQKQVSYYKHQLRQLQLKEQNKLNAYTQKLRSENNQHKKRIKSLQNTILQKQSEKQQLVQILNEMRQNLAEARKADYKKDQEVRQLTIAVENLTALLGQSRDYGSKLAAHCARLEYQTNLALQKYNCQTVYIQQMGQQIKQLTQKQAEASFQLIGLAADKKRLQAQVKLLNQGSSDLINKVDEARAQSKASKQQQILAQFQLKRAVQQGSRNKLLEKQLFKTKLQLESIKKQQQLLSSQLHEQKLRNQQLNARLNQTLACQSARQQQLLILRAKLQVSFERQGQAKFGFQAMQTKAAQAERELHNCQIAQKHLQLQWDRSLRQSQERERELRETVKELRSQLNEEPMMERRGEVGQRIRQIEEQLFKSEEQIFESILGRRIQSDKIC